MLSNDNESHIHRTDYRFYRGNTLQRIRDPNMPGSEINQTDQRLARVHRQQSKIAIVREHHTTFRNRPREHDRVRSTSKTQLHRGDNVLSLSAQRRSHLRMNVLVG